MPTSSACKRSLRKRTTYLETSSHAHSAQDYDEARKLMEAAPSLFVSVLNVGACGLLRPETMAAPPAPGASLAQAHRDGT